MLGILLFLGIKKTRVEWEPKPQNTPVIPIGLNLSQDLLHSPLYSPVIPAGLNLSEVYVVAVVFVGRREYLEILFPYLLSNMAFRGGVIQEVWLAHKKTNDFDFMERTVNRENRIQNRLAWIILEKHEAKAKENPEKHEQLMDDAMSQYYILTQNPIAKNRRILFFKLDDDVVYIDPKTFGAMTYQKALNPRDMGCLFISASVVNHCRLSHQMQKKGAILDFQELEHKEAWKLRGLDSKFVYEDDPFGDCSWASWQCAANIHESLLFRIANQTSERFDVGGLNLHEGNDFMRWSINFFIFDPLDLEEAHFENDELLISHSIPKEKNRICCVGENAVVAHFAYFKQRLELEAKTNLTARYRNLAGEYFPDFYKVDSENKRES